MPAKRSKDGVDEQAPKTRPASQLVGFQDIPDDVRETMLKSMDVRSLMSLAATSKENYFAAIKCLFERDGYEAEVAQYQWLVNQLYHNTVSTLSEEHEQVLAAMLSQRFKNRMLRSLPALYLIYAWRISNKTNKNEALSSPEILTEELARQVVQKLPDLYEAEAFVLAEELLIFRNADAEKYTDAKTEYKAYLGGLLSASMNNFSALMALILLKQTSTIVSPGFLNCLHKATYDAIIASAEKQNSKVGSSPIVFFGEHNPVALISRNDFDWLPKHTFTFDMAVLFSSLKQNADFQDFLIDATTCERLNHWLNQALYGYYDFPEALREQLLNEIMKMAYPALYAGDQRVLENTIAGIFNHFNQDIGTPTNAELTKTLTKVSATPTDPRYLRIASFIKKCVKNQLNHALHHEDSFLILNLLATLVMQRFAETDAQWTNELAEVFANDVLTIFNKQPKILSTSDPLKDFPKDFFDWFELLMPWVFPKLSEKTQAKIFVNYTDLIKALGNKQMIFHAGFFRRILLANYFIDFVCSQQNKPSGQAKQTTKITAADVLQRYQKALNTVLSESRLRSDKSYSLFSNSINGPFAEDILHLARTLNKSKPNVRKSISKSLNKAIEKVLAKFHVGLNPSRQRELANLLQAYDELGGVSLDMKALAQYLLENDAISSQTMLFFTNQILPRMTDAERTLALETLQKTVYRNPSAALMAQVLTLVYSKQYRLTLACNAQVICSAIDAELTTLNENCGIISALSDAEANSSAPAKTGVLTLKGRSHNAMFHFRDYSQSSTFNIPNRNHVFADMEARSSDAYFVLNYLTTLISSDQFLELDSDIQKKILSLLKQYQDTIPYIPDAEVQVDLLRDAFATARNNLIQFLTSDPTNLKNSLGGKIFASFQICNNGFLVSNPFGVGTLHEKNSTFENLLRLMGLGAAPIDPRDPRYWYFNNDLEALIDQDRQTPIMVLPSDITETNIELFRDTIARRIIPQDIGGIQEGRFVMPVNVTGETTEEINPDSGMHWVGVMFDVITHDHNPRIEVIITDPVGNGLDRTIADFLNNNDFVAEKFSGIDDTLARLLRLLQQAFTAMIEQNPILKNIPVHYTVTHQEQQTNPYDCGPWTVENLNTFLRTGGISPRTAAEAAAIRQEQLPAVLARVAQGGPQAQPAPRKEPRIDAIKKVNCIARPQKLAEAQSHIVHYIRSPRYNGPTVPALVPAVLNPLPLAPVTQQKLMASLLAQRMFHPAPAPQAQPQKQKNKRSDSDDEKDVKRPRGGGSP